MAYEGGVNPQYQVPMSPVASAATASISPEIQAKQSDVMSQNLDEVQKIIGPLLTRQSQSVPMGIPQTPHTGPLSMNMRSNSTASGAKTNSMMTTVQGAAEIIRTVKRKKEEKDNRILQFDMERLMGAKNALAQLDPNDPKNAEAIRINNQIIDDITSDPKKAKRIEKAMDIHLLDPSKNSKESQATIKAAQSTQQKGQQSPQQGGQQGQQQQNPHREAILRALQSPVGMGVNPNLEPLIKLATAGLVMTPKEIEANKTKIDAARIKADATDRHTQGILHAADLKIQAAVNLEGLRASHNLDRDSARHIQRLGEIAAAMAGRARLLGMKGGAANSDKRLKADKSLLGMVDDNIKETQAMLKASDEKIAAADNPHFWNSEATKTEREAHISNLNIEKKNLQDTLSILRANKQELLTDANTAAQGVGSEGITESVDELVNGFNVPGEEDDATDATDDSNDDDSN